MTNIVDRLVTTGSTQMRKYVNVKIWILKISLEKFFQIYQQSQLSYFETCIKWRTLFLESTLPSLLQLGMLGLMTASLHTKTKYSDTV